MECHLCKAVNCRSQECILFKIYSGILRIQYTKSDFLSFESGSRWEIDFSCIETFYFLRNTAIAHY